MDEAILNERMIQLKRARSGYKSVLTRRKNELLELMKSHDQVSVEAIKRKNDEIDETFLKVSANMLKHVCRRSR